MKFYTHSRYERYGEWLTIPPTDNALVLDEINGRILRGAYRRHIRMLRYYAPDLTFRTAARQVRSLMWDSAFVAQLATSHTTFVSYKDHPAYTPEEDAG